jgi:asparagine synthase (glutamine-hydrolysing)
MLEDKNNLDVLKIPYDDVNPWTDVEKVIWHHDEPILSISTIAHYQMMRLLKEKTDITVVLSGQGGDEALGGYNKYFYHSLKDKLSTKDFTGFVKDFFLLLPKFSSEFSINAARRYTGLSGIQSNQFKCILNTKPVFKSLMTANTFMDRQIVDYFQFSVPPLCHYEDRNSMAFSKEIRLPFLDYRLAEFSINLPLDLKMKNGFTKYILRLAMDELPSKLRWRKDKKGFTLDENRYFSGTHLEFIKSQFQFSKLDEMGIIDKKRLLKSISNEKPTIWARDLGRLVFAEIWLKQFFK